MLNEKILNFLKTHKQEITKNFQVKTLAIFGSQAKNTATKNSDIDLIIDFKKVPSMYEAKKNLRQFLEKETGKKVDLVRIKYVKSFAKKTIEKSSIPI